MRKKMRKLLAVFFIASLVFCHFTSMARAQEYTKNLDEKGGYMVGDLAVIRPEGTVATAVGAVVYVISLPFSLGGGNEEESRQIL